LLEACNISFSYDGIKNVIGNLNLTVAPGERIGIYGANGSGKTTLSRLLAGLLEPCEGKVRIDGVETGSRGVANAWLGVALVFQDPNDQIVETRVDREIAFGLRNLGLKPKEIEERVGCCLNLLGIEKLRMRSCQSLSAGEKQLVNIASALAMNPRYIILDEPTSLLDSNSRKVFFVALKSVLKTSGAGLVLISGRMEEIFFCKRVGLLDKGSFSFLGEKRDFLRYLVEDQIELDGTTLLFTKIARVFPQALDLISKEECLDPETTADCIENLRRRMRKEWEEERLGD